MRTWTAAFVVTFSLGACKSTDPSTRNPPAPRPVDTRGVPLDLRPDEVIRNPDGSCHYIPPVECPPPDVATCNPPAPIPVACPGEPGASGAPAGSSASPSASPSATPSPSIGMATMEADGTIVLQLRAEGPDGAVGDALVRYPKGDPKYAEVLRHVGGLEPGESKPVPPWPQ